MAWEDWPQAEDRERTCMDAPCTPVCVPRGGGRDGQTMLAHSRCLLSPALPCPALLAPPRDRYSYLLSSPSRVCCSSSGRRRSDVYKKAILWNS